MSEAYQLLDDIERDYRAMIRDLNRLKRREVAAADIESLPIIQRIAKGKRDLAIALGGAERPTVTPEQEKLFAELRGLQDQIEKGHFLNAHFRAFRLAFESWQEHIRQNAIKGSQACQSPAGAVLDDQRSDNL